MPIAFAYLDEHGRRISWGFDLDPARMTCLIEIDGLRGYGAAASAQDAYREALASMKKEVA
jgi:hypothetical protein